LNKPLKETLSRELAIEGKHVREELKNKQQNLLENLPLQEYAIGGTDEEWKKVESKTGFIPSSVSIRAKGGSKPKDSEPKEGGGKRKK